MRIGIYGYGNLGKGVELAARMHEDIELVGIFTRRAPSTVKPLTDAKVYGAEELSRFKEEIDCLIVCGGSATDLPVLSPALASDFNLIDMGSSVTRATIVASRFSLPASSMNLSASALSTTTAILS